ncbi:MAG: patatin-like phospholipase family protein [Candidatus Limnocylindria bacterium]
MSRLAAPAPMTLASGFSLALGGGGARGFAHLGVAEALAERGLIPGRIVGTSMGSVIGAGLAAGLSAERIVAFAERVDPWRMARRPARLAVFDHRPLMERVVAEVGDPRIEDLPIQFAVATYDLVTGRQELITRGRVADALIRSCAFSVVFSPITDGNAIWADAGVWEPVPISLTRQLSPEPVVGVLVIRPKPAWFATSPIAWSLRFGARLLATEAREERLGARRYAALLAARITDPVVEVPADLLIVPNLRGVSWVRFGNVETPRRRGYEAARRALAGVVVARPQKAPAAVEA